MMPSLRDSLDSSGPAPLLRMKSIHELEKFNLSDVVFVSIRGETAPSLRAKSMQAQTLATA
jgi:hypothetical protein